MSIGSTPGRRSSHTAARRGSHSSTVGKTPTSLSMTNNDMPGGEARFKPTGTLDDWIARHYPTLVLEFSSTDAEIHPQYSASRWICMTAGNVGLAIVIVIEYDRQWPKIAIGATMQLWKLRENLEVARSDFLSMNDGLVTTGHQPIKCNVVYGIDDQGLFVQGSETGKGAFDHYGTYLSWTNDSTLV